MSSMPTVVGWLMKIGATGALVPTNWAREPMVLGVGLGSLAEPITLIQLPALPKSSELTPCGGLNFQMGGVVLNSKSLGVIVVGPQGSRARNCIEPLTMKVSPTPKVVPPPPPTMRALLAYGTVEELV